MRAILIDPFEKTVKYVETSGQLDDCHGLPGMYTLLQCSTVDARSIGVARDTLWFDDEGILGDLDKQEFFVLGAYPYPFAGRGLILGTDAEGGCEPPSVQLALIATSARFLDNHAARRRYAAVAEADRLIADNSLNTVFAGPRAEDVLPKEG